MKHSHSICVVTNDNHPTLYGKVSSYLSKGYAVVYAVESSAVADTIQRMNDAGVRAANYIQDSALTVLNRNSVYSQSETNFESRLLLERWKAIISEVSQRGKFKGIAIMGMPEPFFETINHQKLVEYEELVSREFDGSFEAICCYRQESVADLPLKYLISLLNSHQYAVTDADEYSEWHPTNVLEMIIRGLEKTVGKKTSKLAFEEMKGMHKIDEMVVISQPGAFENVIRKMFADSADALLDAIKGEIIRDILFGQRSCYPKSHDIEKLSTSSNFLLCPSCYWSATAIVNWKPDICPGCHNSVIRSVPLNFAKQGNVDASTN